MRPRPTRILLALALALVGALSLAAVAEAAAGTVEVYDGGTWKRIQYQGTNDANQVTFGGSSALHTVTITEPGIAEPGATADPGNICSLAGDTVTCTDPELGVNGGEAGLARMGGGNDATTGEGTQSWTVYGDEGEDSLTGSDQGNDHLYGEEHNDTIDTRGDSGRPYNGDQADGGLGNDVLRGGPGDDYMSGGEGNDELDGGDDEDGLYGDQGTDTLRGGAGNDYLAGGEGDADRAEGGEGADDVLCYGEAGETYDGGGGFDLIECWGAVETPTTFESDDYVIDLAGGVLRRTNHVQTVSTLTSFEDAEAGDGNDVLIGTDGPNRLTSSRGNDTIDGRGGSDQISANRGDDTIEAADGAPDRVDAGDGSDGCHADPFDESFACEALTLAPAPDTAAPACTLRGLGGDRQRGRIAFRVTCDESASLGAEATGRLRKLRRGALASGVGDVTLGMAKSRVGAGAAVRMVVKVSKRYRRALPKRGRIRLALTATDTAGNHKTIARTVRMR